MATSPEKQPKPQALAKETKRRIQRIKNGLVLQVALQNGLFWEEVRETRTRWGIQAPTRVPRPEDRDLLYPEHIVRAQRGEVQLSEHHIYDLHNWERDIKRLCSWLVVPGLERYRLDLDWHPFMAALVLFQPPLDHLLEFAKYGGIERKDPYAEYRETLRSNPEFRRKEAATYYDPALVSPLIHRFPTPYSLAQVWQDYYETLMEEINKRFLKPRGLDIDELRAEVRSDGTFDKSLQERLREIPLDLYVEIPPHATIDELRKAVELGAQMREEPEKARAKEVEASEKKLICVELAYRNDHLGQGFDSDVVQQRYPKIKNSSETHKRYVSYGRKQLTDTTEDTE